MKLNIYNEDKKYNENRKHFWGPCKIHESLIYDKDTDYYFCSDCGLYMTNLGRAYNYTPKYSLVTKYIEQELKKYRIYNQLYLSEGDVDEITYDIGSCQQIREIIVPINMKIEDLTLTDLNILKDYMEKTRFYCFETYGEADRDDEY